MIRKRWIRKAVEAAEQHPKRTGDEKPGDPAATTDQARARSPCRIGRRSGHGEGDVDAAAISTTRRPTAEDDVDGADVSEIEGVASEKKFAVAKESTGTG